MGEIIILMGRFVMPHDIWYCAFDVLDYFIYSLLHFQFNIFNYII